jgi:cytochrome c biogenesis protein CcdA
VSRFLAALPLVVVMIAGPQIVSAVLLATSERAKAVSVAFLAGAGVSVSLAVLGFFALARAVDPPESGGDGGNGPIDYLIPILLVVLGIRVYLRRDVSEPPEWMGRLHRANPAFALGLGFLLFLLMPTDVIATFTVGSALAREDGAWWGSLVFAGLTVLAAGVPLWTVLLFGARADVALPRIREWMTSHSWIISEIVITFFLLVAVASLV